MQIYWNIITVITVDFVESLCRMLAFPLATMAKLSLFAKNYFEAIQVTYNNPMECHSGQKWSRIFWRPRFFFCGREQFFLIEIIFLPSRLFYFTVENFFHSREFFCSRDFFHSREFFCSRDFFHSRQFFYSREFFTARIILLSRYLQTRTFYRGEYIPI